MITTKTIHEIHNAKLDTLISEVEEELSLLVPTRTLYRDYFNTNREKYKLRIDYEILNKGEHKPIEFPLDNSDKYFNIQLKNFNEHTLLYFNKQKEIQKLQKQKINESVFVFILRRFNTLLAEAIVKDGYHFFSLYIGKLKVKIVERKKPEINWGESMKARDKLIEQNLVPFIKEDARVANETNKEYNGIKWLVYLPDIATYFDWELETAQYIRIPNMRNFNFVPVRGLQSPVVLLRRFEETLTQEELYNKYNTIKNAN